MKCCSDIRITKLLKKPGYMADCRVGKESGRPSLGLPTCRTAHCCTRALFHPRATAIWTIRNYLMQWTPALQTSTVGSHLARRVVEKR